MSYLRWKQCSRDFIEKSCKPEQHVGYSPEQVVSEDSSILDKLFLFIEFQGQQTANSRFKSLIHKITKSLSTLYSAKTHTATFLY